MFVQDGLPPRERTRALWVIIPGILVTVLDGTIVNLALPDITRELHATAAQSIWVINAYQIAIIALLLPLATLGDAAGYRRVYLFGMALFTAASVACTFADSLTTLALARGVQGVGAAGIMGVNAALVRLTYPRARLGRGIALNSMVVAGGTVAGPSIAAAVLSVASWPWLFAINVPIGVFCLLLGRSALPHNLPRADTPRISWLDVVLNILMFTLVVLGLDGLGVRPEVQGAAGQGVPVWLGAAELALGVAIGVFYVRRQLKQPLPLFPVDLLRIPVFALSMGTSIGAFCAQMLAYVGLPFLLLDSYGRTHLEAGLLLTAWPVGIAMTALVAGRLIGRLSGGVLGGTGLGLMALGLALLALLPTQPTNADIVWRMLICGMGFGLFQSPNNHIILTSAPAHRSGGAGGMLGTARLTGQIMGAVLLAMIFGVFDPHDGKGPLIALWLAAGFAAVAGTFSALRIRHL
ncbi:MAG: MFS transporter [Polaromonas sp.]|uniref:MFS transporter n=1 Tax=Polaromonas sp. TaxID=1869339 RepID=UPI0025D85A21|nr:MFS transporter [Polaromonas sp.]MBI2726072.1 MFS transporter [Polaromonas sp.]